LSKTLPHIAEAVQQGCIEGLIKGYDKIELLNMMVKSYPEMPSDEIETCIRRAYNIIKDTTLTEIDKIIPMHVEIYEKIYAEFDDLYYIPGKLAALRGKEKLLSMHNESTSIEVHNELNIEVEASEKYDLGKLTEQEQSRLEELMKKIENDNR
jgi:hypothetical protein